MIHTKNLELTYPDQPRAAFTGVSLDVAAGDVLGVVGPMGAGKTSLCMTLAGLAPRSSGGSSEGELNLVDLDPRDSAITEVARRVSLVFEDYASQLTQITVVAEVMAPLINQGTPVAEARLRALQLLDELGLGHLDVEHKRTWELSGGQQQRVAIAAALASDPQVLILDNVTGLLDPAGKEEIRRLAGELSTRMTLAVVEDDVDLLVGIADQLLVLRDGGVHAHGRADDLLRDVDLLTDAQVEPPTVAQIARAADIGSSPLTVDELTIASRPLEDEVSGDRSGEAASAADTAQPVSAPAVEIRGADFRYRDGTAAVRDVSMRVAPGQVHAVVGGNGAGKSTLLRMLCGLLRPSTGEVVIGGLDTREHSPAELARVVGTALQNPDEQITERTVHEEIAFPLRQRQFRRSGWFRREKVLSDEHIAEAVDRARSLVGLPSELMENDPTQLSKGHRKLVAIAAALALEPAVLVLDEPRVSLDAPARAALRHLLHQLRAQGTAVVLVEHDLDLVAETADTITLLDAGRVLTSGSPREVFGSRGAETLARTSLLPPRAAQIAGHLGFEAFSVAELAAQLDPVPQEA
ncbi:energy-coupling factor transporter ATPase [Saccharopolyspora halophila]|uniref:Energy-coupling factor transporter ATPase n=1 Tax=Saccharopolyspora halophila TaxID=405551 RepID=A0ABN3GVP9_9PSEU